MTESYHARQNGVQGNAAPLTVADYARQYIALGFAPVPVPYREKGPVIKGWQNLRLGLDDVNERFRGNNNIGLIVGDASRGLVDIDLDCPEAIRAADVLLPHTPMVSGRQSASRAHRWFRVGTPTTKKRTPFQDPLKAGGDEDRKAMVVEFRTANNQTIVPPSVHESGETISWMGTSLEPTPIEEHDLFGLCSDVAGAALLARYWPNKGGRHDAAMALAGWLQRGGKEEERAKEILEAVAVAAGDDEVADRVACIETTYERIGEGKEATGFTRLQQVIDRKVLAKAGEWLGLSPVIAVVEAREALSSNGHVNGTATTNLNGVAVTAQTSGSHAAVDFTDTVEDVRAEIDASDGDLVSITAKAWSALLAANVPPRWFRHVGGISRIEADDDGALVIRELTQERLRHDMATVARFVQEKRRNRASETVDVYPPTVVIQNMAATPDIPLPVLDTIVSAPVFGPHGDLQLSPGYHAGSRTFFAPTEGLQIGAVPERPTVHDVARARHLIVTELFGDFPFVSDADRANAVALTILPFVRRLISGPTPLHMVEAPGPGVGKGKLATVALSPSIGRRVGIVTQCDDDEMRKRVTAQLVAGRAAILLDNVSRLDSDVLAAVLTNDTWEDRRLGSNEMVRIPVRQTWVVTANNIVLSTDLMRRTVRIRLDAGIDRPWRRKTDVFRHPDLVEWAHENRADLVWAGLTLGQAWIAGGRPEFTQRVLGSFERWSAVMGGILTVAGVPGFLENLDEFYEVADVEGAVWRSFVSAWWAKFRKDVVSTSDLFPLALALDDFPLDGRTDRAQRISCGKALMNMRDRVIGDFRIVPSGTAQRAQQWRLLPVQPQKVKTVNVSECFSATPCEENIPYRGIYGNSASNSAGDGTAETFTDIHSIHSPSLPTERDDPTNPSGSPAWGCPDCGERQWAEQSDGWVCKSCAAKWGLTRQVGELVYPTNANGQRSHATRITAIDSKDGSRWCAVEGTATRCLEELCEPIVAGDSSEVVS